jgi:F-type H+-transporting ATPase subunit gamma
MPTLLDYRRRIRSIRSTQQITKTMKMVAAARLRRAQERVFSARPYAQEILAVLRSLVSRIPEIAPGHEGPLDPLLARRPEEKVLVLVLTGDRGLCGAFNANVLRRAMEFFREKERCNLQIIAIGKKGRDYFRSHRRRVVEEYVNVSSQLEFVQAHEIAERAAALYAEGNVDAVYAIYNEFKTVLAQKLITEKLLPIEEISTAKEEWAAGGTRAAARPAAQPAPDARLVDYIYEQPARELLEALVTRHLATQVFRILLESAAAEHAARMTAMDAATNNAAELIDRITLEMNRTRQATITKEIIEIVSGAAALK